MFIVIQDNWVTNHSHMRVILENAVKKHGGGNTDTEKKKFFFLQVDTSDDIQIISE